MAGEWVNEVIPEDFTVEHDGKQVPAREHEFFKNNPDLPSFLKRSWDNHREVGRRVPLPSADMKPEDKAKWQEEHLQKFADAGLINYRDVPDEYTVTRPENIPEEAWSPELEGKAKEWAKKHELSQEALDEAVSLYHDSLTGVIQAAQVDRQAQAAKIAEWAKTEGHTVEEIDAALERWNKDPRGWDQETAEAVSKSGWADNPLVVKAIYKLMSDAGFNDTRGANGEQSANGGAGAAAAEIKDIINNKDNPKHALYLRGDKDTLAYVSNLHRKAYPGETNV